MFHVKKEEFDTELQKLNHNIERQLSFKRSFLQSMINGVGAAIGATIVAGIVVSILSLTVHSLSDVPILNKIVPASVVETYLNTNHSSH